MIEDDDIDGAFAKPLDRRHGGRAAIDGEKKRGGKFFQAVRRGLEAEAVAFIHAVRQVEIDLPAEVAEHRREQRGGGDAINIVVPMNINIFLIIDCFFKSVNNFMNVRKQPWIMQFFRTKIKKILSKAQSFLSSGLR